MLESSCCDMLSYLCMKIKPRYIVSGLEGVFYERLPFRCPVLGDNDSTMETVTRFIGLARVGNAEKAKWIYALNLTPIDKMRVSELMQKTIDETPCPFNFMELESKSKVFNAYTKVLFHTLTHFTRTLLLQFSNNLPISKIATKIKGCITFDIRHYYAPTLS